MNSIIVERVETQSEERFRINTLIKLISVIKICVCSHAQLFD